MTYIIAEIGQNHNGRVDAAHALIEAAAVPIRDELTGEQLRGVDAVKLTKRDLDAELTLSAAAVPYETEHSYGRTYGEHRERLELTYDELYECEQHAHSLGLDFIVTVCAPSCIAAILMRFKPAYFKVASRDLTNIPLLMALAESGVPLILSTGMARSGEVPALVTVVERAGGRVDSVLHCVSIYPPAYDELALGKIEEYRDWFAGAVRIGYSDHSVGIVMAPVAVALGAEVIEKHITLSRAERGSDHAGSLEPDGLRRMVRDIRNVEAAMRWRDTEPAGLDAVRVKLERSISAAVRIPAGSTIDSDNTCMLSPGDGYGWRDRHKVFGKVAVRDIAAREHIRPADVGFPEQA